MEKIEERGIEEKNERAEANGTPEIPSKFNSSNLKTISIA